MENAAIIRKASGDYEDTKNGRLKSGSFWEIKVEGLVIRRAGSIKKSEIVEMVKSNFGREIEILERVA